MLRKFALEVTFGLLELITGGFDYLEQHAFTLE